MRSSSSRATEPGIADRDREFRLIGRSLVVDVGEGPRTPVFLLPEAKTEPSPEIPAIGTGSSLRYGVRQRRPGAVAGPGLDARAARGCPRETIMVRVTEFPNTVPQPRVPLSAPAARESHWPAGSSGVHLPRPRIFVQHQRLSGESLMFLMRLGTAAALLAAGFGVTACSTYDGYGYGGVSVGYGYADPWYDSYWDYYDSYPYWGWYDDYYYPGIGIYVYDHSGRRFRWSDRHRRFWTQRHHHWRDRRDFREDRREFRENWRDFRRDRRGDRRDFRQDRRELRRDFRQGDISRERFREDRRELRRDFRRERRQDRRGLRRENRRDRRD